MAASSKLIVSIILRFEKWKTDASLSFAYPVAKISHLVKKKTDSFLFHQLDEYKVKGRSGVWWRVKKIAPPLQLF